MSGDNHNAACRPRGHREYFTRRDGSLGELEDAHPPAPDEAFAPGVHADVLQRMMSSLIASGPGHLQLSKSQCRAAKTSGADDTLCLFPAVNMGGVGAAAMTHIMKSHSLPSVPGLLKVSLLYRYQQPQHPCHCVIQTPTSCCQSAIASGKVRFTACTMSMEASE